MPRAGVAAPKVIIGAGECGAKAALSLRDRGWDGEIVLIGAESELPYERPPLSKAVMIDPAGCAPRPTSREQFEEAGVELRLGQQVASIDTHGHTVSLSDGSVLPYSSLLIATGARARVLPTPEDVAERIHYLRTEIDAHRLRARLTSSTRVVVIGGGFIGLELASSAIALGCRVDVVELAPRLLSRAVPAALAERLAARHAEAGVRIHLDAVIETLTPLGSDGVAVTLADGQVLEADVVIAGVGSVPNTELAEAAGVLVVNGISVDERLATSALDVFAAGDCCCLVHPLYPGAPARFESWRLALEQGVHAAGSMLGEQAAFSPVPWFWSDQHDLTLQVAGLARDVTTEVLREQADGGLLWFGLEPSGRLVAMAVLGSPSVVRELRIGERLIGAQATPSPDELADPNVSLRGLLKALRA